jgi:hypothetical protein
MKKYVKLASLFTILSFFFYAPVALSDGISTKSLGCKILPWTCVASPMGAGGTGHGGPEPGTGTGTGTGNEGTTIGK